MKGTDIFDKAYTITFVPQSYNHTLINAKQAKIKRHIEMNAYLHYQIKIAIQ